MNEYKEENWNVNPNPEKNRQVKARGIEVVKVKTIVASIKMILPVIIDQMGSIFLKKVEIKSEAATAPHPVADNKSPSVWLP